MLRAYPFLATVMTLRFLTAGRHSVQDIHGSKGLNGEVSVWGLKPFAQLNGRKEAKRTVDVSATNIAGVQLLKPRFFYDSRGHFVETYNKRSAQGLGLLACFVQDNQSLSIERGTVRGLHFQTPPRSQAKLVRVLRGSIHDVAVDHRVGSPTYGRWTAHTLTANGSEQLYIPHGFAHGFCTLEPNSEVAYKVDDYYAPECDQGLAWDDPTLAIDWPVSSANAVLSDKDRKLGRFADLVSPFRYNDT
jgi:dTDP-4-dehydrorhamnose 3,5-epimerase